MNASRRASAGGVAARLAWLSRTAAGASGMEGSSKVATSAGPSSGTSKGVASGTWAGGWLGGGCRATLGLKGCLSGPAEAAGTSHGPGRPQALRPAARRESSLDGPLEGTEVGPADARERTRGTSGSSGPAVLVESKEAALGSCTRKGEEARFRSAASARWTPSEARDIREAAVSSGSSGPAVPSESAS